MVINEHPFNPVVEELGVIPFFTWKKKGVIIDITDMKWNVACDKRFLLTAQVVNFIVSFMFSV